MNYFNMGVLTGFLVVFVFIMVWAMYCRYKKQSIFQEYDERQLAARYKAFSQAFLFFTTLIVLDGVIKLCGICWYEEPFGEFAILLLTLIVFGWNSVMNDAFLGRAEQGNMKKYLALYFCIGISQLVIGLTDLDRVMAQGKISLRALPLISGVTFLSIGLAFLLLVTTLREAAEV